MFQPYFLDQGLVIIFFLNFNQHYNGDVQQVSKSSGALLLCTLPSVRVVYNDEPFSFNSDGILPKIKSFSSIASCNRQTKTSQIRSLECVTAPTDK